MTAALSRDSETRRLAIKSADIALESGAVAPAVLGGLLLVLSDHVVSHAIDAARGLVGYRHRGVLLTMLEQIEREERGA